MVCTWFLQTSMYLVFKARTDIARTGFAFYGPFAFVIGATQHVIANIGFRGLPLLLSAFHPEAPHTALTWGVGAHGLLTNIVITTVGIPDRLHAVCRGAVPARHHTAGEGAVVPKMSLCDLTVAATCPLLGYVYHSADRQHT